MTRSRTQPKIISQFGESEYKTFLAFDIHQLALYIFIKYPRTQKAVSLTKLNIIFRTILLDLSSSC